MKLSLLPVVILLLLVLGRVDLVSSVCSKEGETCRSFYSCCSGLECVRVTCRKPPPPTPAPSQAPSQSQEPSKSIEPSQSPSQSLKPSRSMEPSQQPSQEPLVGRWVTITHDTFDHNSGYGSFEEHYKPGRIKHTDSGSHIYKGTHSVAMTKACSIRQKDSHDVTDYEKLRVRFWAYSKNMDDSDDDNSDNDDHVTLFVYRRKIGDEWHHEQASHYLGGDNGRFIRYSYTTSIANKDEIKLLLELDASKGDEKIFVDEIRVEGFKNDVSTPWYVITSDDFEGGWGSFTAVDDADDGEDAVRVSNPSSNEQYFVPEGNAALRIRDDSGKESSVFHKDGHDLTGYSRCRVSFQFSAWEVDQDNGFDLQYSSNNGTDWTKVKKYIKNGKEDPEDGGVFYFRNVQKHDGYWNYRFYSDTVVLKGEDYNLTTKSARIRFHSKVSRDEENVYIDQVQFECRKS